MGNKHHKVFVYGTLRPGENTELHIIPGRMYDLGAFPGVKLSAPEEGSFIIAETVTVDDAGLARLDQYEGYRENSPENSLYIRRPWLDGWIYEYNHDTQADRQVENGDWLKYVNRSSGSAAGLGSNVL